MEDRFTRGFFAGFLAGVIQAAYNLLANYLRITTVSWFSVAGVLIYGHRPRTTAEEIFSWLIAMGFSGAMGVLFAYLLPQVTSHQYHFKGIFFGVAVWFVSFALTVLFRIPGLSQVDFASALTNFVGACIWGVLTAEFLRRLGKVSV